MPTGRGTQNQEGETMKRWTSTWIAVLVTGFLAVPSIGLAKATTSVASAQPNSFGVAGSQQQQQPATPPSEPTPSPSTPSQQPTSPQPPTTPPAEPPTTQPPTTQPPATAQPPAEATAQKVDPEAAKKALTAARDSLAQMTQLPAAQALTGEPRAQVSQLITNFNELITTSSDWKAAYAKVDANVSALLGSQGPDESPAPSPAPSTAPPSPASPPSSTTPPATTTPPTAGAAGAVGTSGTTTGSLDPAIKAKLGEFRAHLKEFEKAAGGGTEK
jgi:hypothetical protein